MSDDDWGEPSLYRADVDIPEPKKSGASTPAVVPARAPARGKWADEDAEPEQEDDWDASDTEKPKPAAAPAPVRKKKLAEKLAEKERASKVVDDDLMDTRTEQERARDRKRELLERERAADLDVAADLLGEVDIADPKATKETLESILLSKPKTKDEFATLSKQIMALIISKHAENPLYPAFVEGFAKDICEPLSAVQVRKVGSGLSTLGNTKQAEERDKASGKKKAASKPKLGANKAIMSVDVDAYDDALDDGDFM